MFNPEILVKYTYLLIAVPIVVVVAIILLIAMLTFKNWAKWKVGFLLAQQRDWKNTHRPDGNLYPPVARGICQQCETYSPCVFSMDDIRICKSCYDEQHTDEYSNNVNSHSGKDSGENHE